MVCHLDTVNPKFKFTFPWEKYSSTATVCWVYNSFEVFRQTYLKMQNLYSISSKVTRTQMLNDFLILGSILCFPHNRSMQICFIHCVLY